MTNIKKGIEPEALLDIGSWQCLCRKARWYWALAHMAINTDIIVVGGGIVGATFALQLAASDLGVVVVDRKSPEVASLDGEFDHRVYALTPTNMASLEDLDVFQAQDRARLTSIRAMEIFGDKQAKLTFSAREINRNELAVMIEHRLLARRLAEKLAVASHIQYLDQSAPKSLSVDADAVSLLLDDGTKIEAALVVGADGAKSWVRDERGFSAREKDYEQIALVANFQCEKNHSQVARQWFAYGGILAWLPLGENIISIVWSLPAARAEELYLLPAEEFCRAVADGGTNTLGVMRLVSPVARFPLASLRSDGLVKPRVALIGDAAHVIHPLAGQGLNLGLRDADTLAQVLCERATPENVGDAALLRRYERSRKEALAGMHLVTDGLQGLFAMDSAIAAGLRNGGLGLVENMPWLKKMLMRHAIG